MTPPAVGDNVITSLRRDNWKPCKPGPDVDFESTIAYDYATLTPDTTFMLNTCAFSGALRTALVHRAYLRAWLADSYGCCPYLTVEYKSESTGGLPIVARNQIALASACWLLQLKRLRTKVSSSYKTGLRHFGIVITATVFEIWKAELDANTEQYKMQCLARGSALSADDLKVFADWINAIHRWGLGPHREAFTKDLEELKRQRDAAPPVPSFPASNAGG
jgi:hypothetical protein